MHKIQRSYNEYIFFQFIQCSINPERGFANIEKIENIKWDEFFEFCNKQAIVGIVCDGIDKCKKEGIKIDIPQQILFEWIAQAEQIRWWNQLLFKRTAEVSCFFQKAGFRSCILKGQGNALMYPNQYCRTPGDIDIWVEGERDKITSFVRSLTPNVFEQYQHIDFPYFNDVTVEVHYSPSRLNSPFNNKKLQKYFNEQRDIQFDNRNFEIDKKGNTRIPSDGFNSIFQIMHIMTHFFNEGIGLRQFIDYYFLLNKGLNDIDRKIFKKTIKKLGAMKFAKGVMWIENTVLGLDEKNLLLEPNEEIGKLMLKEILATGDKGEHDTRFGLKRKGMISKGLVAIYRDLMLSPSFPSESLWKVYRKMENQRWKIKHLLRRIR